MRTPRAEVSRGSNSVMESVRILCPKCRAELHLRNRGLLGRRGQCPQCGHRFVLQESDDTELDEANWDVVPDSA